MRCEYCGYLTEFCICKQSTNYCRICYAPAGGCWCWGNFVSPKQVKRLGFPANWKCHYCGSWEPCPCDGEE